jgi:hypothetical protein
MNAPHPDAERLTLAALPAEQADPDVAAHLLVCAECRAEVDVLRRTVELARADGVGEPLPIPPTRVWQAILDELGGEADGPGSPERNGQGTHEPATLGGLGVAEHDRPTGRVSAPDDNGPDKDDVPTRTDATDEGGTTAVRRRTPHRRRRALVGVAAAALVGLGLGVGIGAGIGGSPGEPDPAPVVRLGPVGVADPAATGTAAMVDRDGDQRMVVELRGVSNLAGGDYLEAWLMDSSGSRLLPLGALARHGEEFRGEFTIPAGLPVGEYDRVDVSAERFDGDPGHSTVSLLRGDLA